MNCCQKWDSEDGYFKDSDASVGSSFMKISKHQICASQDFRTAGKWVGGDDVKVTSYQLIWNSNNYQKIQIFNANF